MKWAFKMANKDLIVYQAENGKEPFNDWLDDLKDEKSQARILDRLQRVSLGHYGDYRAVGEGVSELRFFFGAGYRVYFAEVGKTIVLLLCGGDKSSQKRDIKTAQRYWTDYQDRQKESEA